MIKRHYFISTKCGYNDGSPSYSFEWSTIIRKSILPQHQEAFSDALSKAKSHYEEKGLDSSYIEVLAFNRIH